MRILGTLLKTRTSPIVWMGGIPRLRPRGGRHRLVEVQRFAIEKVQKLMNGILRGILVTPWLRLRVLFPLFLLYQPVYAVLFIAVLPRERLVALG